MEGAASGEAFHVDSDGKIRPKVRTRFRSRGVPPLPVINTNKVNRPTKKKKTGKIVLKRRKVKRIREHLRKSPVVVSVNKVEVEDALGQGSAPEANRGRPLAELAFATLSREEQSEETNSVFDGAR